MVHFQLSGWMRSNEYLHSDELIAYPVRGSSNPSYRACSLHFFPVFNSFNYGIRKMIANHVQNVGLTLM